MSETYFHNLRMKDKYTKCPTDWELAQAFPESRDMASTLAYHLRIELKVYDKWIDKDPFNVNFKKIDNRWIRLQKLQKFINFTKPIKGKELIDIEKAKRVSIQDLYDFGKIRHTTGRILTKCPFHVEQHPSFYIFVEQNRFYCYSCNFGGDSISFIQKLHGLNFIDAVKFLNGR